VYATAFKEGYTPETVVFDLKTQFSTSCSIDDFSSEDECYSPSNYDNEFRGPVSLRNALAQSLNIPAVKTLYLAGLDDSLKTARDLGLTTLVGKDRYGLTLVLGGGEVKLVEMVGAYGVFAREGERNDVHGILKIEDNQGSVIEEYTNSTRRVLDRDVALQISDILSDNVARTPLWGANSALVFPGRDVAAKTGTTNDKRDVWILGYTPNLVVGAWAGNNDNESMTSLSGLIITPLWREFMDVALENLPVESFSEAPRTPDTIKPVLRGVWFDPTELLTDDETLISPDLDISQAVAGAHSILYFVDKDDPRSESGGSQNDSQFEYWEYPVSLWKTSLLQVVEEGGDR
jgi:membrane peptidoglycan carboxypeptidase